MLWDSAAFCRSLETFGSRNGDQIWLSVAESFLENVVCGGLRGGAGTPWKESFCDWVFWTLPSLWWDKTFWWQFAYIATEYPDTSEMSCHSNPTLGVVNMPPFSNDHQIRIVCDISTRKFWKEVFFGTLCKGKHVPFEISILVQIYFHGIFV